MEEEMIVLEMTEVEAKFIYDLLYFVNIELFVLKEIKDFGKVGKRPAIFVGCLVNN
jgi:hypothetical protein